MEVEIDELLQEISTSMYGRIRSDFDQHEDASEQFLEIVETIVQIPRQTQFVYGLHERLTALYRRLSDDLQASPSSHVEHILDFRIADQPAQVKYFELLLKDVDASVLKTFRTQLSFWLRRPEALSPKLFKLMEKLCTTMEEQGATMEERGIPVKPDTSTPDWKIPADEVRVNFHEGGGLYQGEWLDTPVDVRKVIGQDNSFFEREANLWGGLSHPNISNLMGVCIDEDGGYFVTEPGESGNMVKYLKDSKDVWRVLYEVALALEYLHERGIVHAGIKPDNVRIGRDGKAKLTGFECSIPIEQLGDGETVALRRDFRWHAPELLRGSQPSFASDVYSLAMLIIAVVSGEPPFSAAVSDDEAQKLLEENQLPMRLGGFSDEHWNLVNDMLCLNAGDRIDVHTVVRRLQHFSAQEKIAEGSSTEELKSVRDDMKSKWLEATAGVKSTTCLQPERLERTSRSPTSELEEHSWTIPQHELFFEESERRGSSGIVERHLGIWLNAEIMIARVCSGNSVLDMKHQAGLWFSLKHPNVQQLYGACEQHGLFVCEYPDGGNLSSYLRKYPDQVWQKLLDISLGLRYLHHRGIVHGRLKTHHFLVDREGKAKLSDLECCLIGQHAAITDEPDEELEAEEKRPIPSYESRWRSPQCLEGEETFESDVYSLGKCFIEAVTGEIPEGSFLPDIAVTGRLPQSSSFGSHYDHLIQEMCSDNEKRRPTMAGVVQRLRCFVAIDNEVKATTYANFQEFLHESQEQREELCALAADFMMKVEQEYAEFTNSVAPSDIAKDTLQRMQDWDLRVKLEEYKHVPCGEEEDEEKEEEQELRNNLEQWHIEPAEVRHTDDILGGGTFANVHVGVWMGTLVAVRRLRDMTEAFEQEVNLWYPLSHPHIVSLFGASKFPHPLFISEYVSNGTLRRYINNIPREGRWRLLYESVLGLQAVHARGVIHADLKCDNILVADTGQAKIADFGLSVYCDRRRPVNEEIPVGGAVRWKAPECLNGREVTKMSDVYSFGMCIIEAISGNIPWVDIRADELVTTLVQADRLPTKPISFQDTEWRLVKAMCCRDPEERISLDLAVRVLKIFARPWDPTEDAACAHVDTHAQVLSEGIHVSPSAWAT
ncbi:hypothetical protein V7S43_015839 [Phytophthora oleae]|uniref:Protein kinase domain-containing protein n=1 Tax=Phytophthora oleae TaxID=2107226 RepID=A0ABD3F0W9_9STRA